MKKHVKKEAKPKWVIHHVTDTMSCSQCGEPKNSFPEGICDAHTHGLDKYGHLELQLVLAFEPEIIAHIMSTLGERIENGERFSNKQLVNGIFEDCHVRMDIVKDCDREDIFRVVVPDEHNAFPEDPGCEYPFNLQLYNTEALYMGEGKEEN